MKLALPSLRPDLTSRRVRFPLWLSSVYLSALCGEGFVFSVRAAA